MQTSKLQPAFLGGLFFGVLSALPIINIGNCCCLWVIGGGLVAAYLLQQAQPTPLEAGDGAVVGLMAGAIGAVVHSVISLPLQLLMGPMQARWMQRLAEQSGNNQDLEPLLRMAGGGGGIVIATILGFFVMLALGLVFGTLGGLLGATLFKKTVPPVPPAPPPASFNPPPFNPPPLSPQ